MRRFALIALLCLVLILSNAAVSAAAVGSGGVHPELMTDAAASAGDTIGHSSGVNASALYDGWIYLTSHTNGDTYSYVQGSQVDVDTYATDYDGWGYYRVVIGVYDTYTSTFVFAYTDDERVSYDRDNWFWYDTTDLEVSSGRYQVVAMLIDEYYDTIQDLEYFELTVTDPGSSVTGVTVVPVAGPNRYATAIAASQKAFPTGSEYVIVATGMNWPDALGGSALAGALDAPILLTSQASLPAEVRSEIVRLGATKAIVLGGTPAVSATVANQIDAISGVSVERIAGPNRYDTANAVAARTIAEMNLRGGYSGTAFVATGMNFPDALGASPLAARQGWPIYLANPAQGANAGLVSVMGAAGVSNAIVLGGANVVASSVESALASLGPVTRLAGANRYDTAVVVANYGVANAGLAWDKVAITTGMNFPDALAGGVLQGKSDAVLLLTPTASLNGNVAATLAANTSSILEVRFLGSTAAVSQTVRNQVTNILRK